MSADMRVLPVGTITDAYGEELEIGIQWDAGADPAEESEPMVYIGDSIALEQEAAEGFAQLFVSACWEAGRKLAEMRGSAPEAVTP